MRLMMSKSKSVARKIIVPSGQLSAGGHTRGRTSQISSTSSWPTMQRRAPSVEERVRGSRRFAASRLPGPDHLPHHARYLTQPLSQFHPPLTTTRSDGRALR